MASRWWQLLWQLNQFPNTQATVGDDLIIKSRQDTYQYTHDQKQAGFSADVGFDGKPQSFSINGSKTNVDTDYAQGIQTQDIQNHLNYQGNAISLGIGVADTSHLDGKAKPALQGLGYGTITPTHKTSTTHAAITDQAGLSHINSTISGWVC